MAKLNAVITIQPEGALESLVQINGIVQQAQEEIINLLRLIEQAKKLTENINVSNCLKILDGK